MISNQILQNTIDGLKNITRVDVCVMDIDGKMLAGTFAGVDGIEDAVRAFANSQADSQTMQGYQFFKIFDEQRLEYVLLAAGDSEEVYMVGKIAAFQLQNLLIVAIERAGNLQFAHGVANAVGQLAGQPSYGVDRHGEFLRPCRTK